MDWIRRWVILTGVWTFSCCKWLARVKVFVELPNDTTYEDAKAALLLAYKVIAEVHRNKFRTQYNSEKDTYADHAYHLNTLFKKWATSLLAYNNLERLRKIILLERFYESLSDDLRVWLVGKDPQTLVEAAKLADTQSIIIITPLVQKTSITTIILKQLYHLKSELLIRLMLPIKTRRLIRSLVKININREKQKTSDILPPIIQLFVSSVIKQTT